MAKGFLLALGFVGFSSPLAALTITIDEGTVLIKTSTKLETPYEISYKGQGSCEPKLRIKESNNLVDVVHEKNCHNTGEREGTIITVVLNARQNHSVKLSAGALGVYLSPETGKVTAEVKVGGMTSTSSRPVNLKRGFLGADGVYQGNSEFGTLDVVVSAGSVKFGDVN